MTLSKKVFAISAVTLILAVTLSGCINVGVTTGLTLLLTDPTNTEIDELWVKIVRIEVYPVGDEDGAIDVFGPLLGDEPLIVDLLDNVFPLTEPVVEDFELPPGDYDHFKLHLGQIEDGEVEDYDNDPTPYYTDVPEGEALAVDYEADPDWFMCVVPPGKFNVNVYDQGTQESYFTKVAGEAIKVTIDFVWNGNVAENGDRNLNPTGTAYVDLEVLPDLIVEKAGLDEVYAGQTVIYTITIEVYDAEAENIEVLDEFPVGWTFVDATLEETDVTGNVITWNILSILPDNSETFDVTFTAAGTVDDEYTNDVNVSCDGPRSTSTSFDITIIAGP